MKLISSYFRVLFPLLNSAPKCTYIRLTGYKHQHIILTKSPQGRRLVCMCNLSNLSIYYYTCFLKMRFKIVSWKSFCLGEPINLLILKSWRHPPINQWHSSGLPSLSNNKKIKLDINLLYQTEMSKSDKLRKAGLDFRLPNNRRPNVDHVLLHSFGMAYFYCLTIPHFAPVLLDWPICV